MTTHGAITVFHSVLQKKGCLRKILNNAIQTYFKVNDSTYYRSYSTYQQIYVDSFTLNWYCECVFDGGSWVFSMVVFVVVFWMSACEELSSWKDDKIWRHQIGHVTRYWRTRATSRRDFVKQAVNPKPRKKLKKQGHEGNSNLIRST